MKEEHQPQEKSGKNHSYTKKDKHKKKKIDKKRSRSRSKSSQSSSNSRSQSSPSSSKQMIKQKKAQQSKPHQNLNRSNLAGGAKKLKVNSHVLSKIISDQKKTNLKLDIEETNKAADKFMQKFSQEIQPVTMSFFLSNEELLRKIQSKQVEGQTSCSFCGNYFANSTELDVHLQSHR